MFLHPERTWQVRWSKGKKIAPKRSGVEEECGVAGRKVTGGGACGIRAAGRPEGDGHDLTWYLLAVVDRGVDMGPCMHQPPSLGRM